jgi:hypothetical protein
MFEKYLLYKGYQGTINKCDKPGERCLSGRVQLHENHWVIYYGTTEEILTKNFETIIDMYLVSLEDGKNVQ